MCQHGPLDDIVVQVEIELLFIFLPESEDQGCQIAREEGAGVARHGRGEIQRRHDRYTVFDNRLTRSAELTVPTPFCSQVYDDGTGLHPAHHVGGDEPGGLYTPDKGCGDDDVTQGALLSDKLRLFTVKLL